MEPVAIGMASAGGPGGRGLPAMVGRLRCGQEAPMKIEPAPQIAHVIGA
jgi:hypothetical protein